MHNRTSISLMPIYPTEFGNGLTEKSELSGSSVEQPLFESYKE